MRILMVGINYAPDLVGVAKYNTELCETLASFGHEVRVVTAPPYYPEWRVPESYRRWSYSAETINNVHIKRAPIYVPGTPTGTKRLLHHASFALTSAWPLISESARWRPDLIFSVAPSLMSAALAARVARSIGAFSWLHVQDFEIDAAFDLGLLKHRGLRNPMITVERRILQSFDRVSTISPHMAARLQYKGVQAEKIREVRNWTDNLQISPSSRNTSFREELCRDSSDFVGLYSGTMSNKQGLDLIIEAAKELEQTSPQIRFVLCGEGPHKAELQSLATGLKNIHFLGLQTNERIAELLSTADFHLIPQKAEAADLVLPSKLGGILATGRPVIVMADPGTGLADEVVGTGLLVPPGNVRALADAARQLKDNPDLCNTLGATARKRALQRWDRTTILTTLEKSLLKAMSRNGAASKTTLAGGDAGSSSKNDKLIAAKTFVRSD
jgi:colanic acid biosynthesis glycosyl transferase WcaI